VQIWQRPRSSSTQALKTRYSYSYNLVSQPPQNIKTQAQTQKAHVPRREKNTFATGLVTIVNAEFDTKILK
jgi:hypothetical protein